jgi:hypothetical protein
MPAYVGGAAALGRTFLIQSLKLAFGYILRSKDDLGGPADPLAFFEAKQPFDTGVPTGDNTPAESIVNTARSCSELASIV